VHGPVLQHLVGLQRSVSFDPSNLGHSGITHTPGEHGLTYWQSFMFPVRAAAGGSSIARNRGRVLDGLQRSPRSAVPARAHGPPPPGAP